jgi:hypothetical protein
VEFGVKLDPFPCGVAVFSTTYARVNVQILDCVRLTRKNLSRRDLAAVFNCQRATGHTARSGWPVMSLSVGAARRQSKKKEEGKVTWVMRDRNGPIRSYYSPHVSAEQHSAGRGALRDSHHSETKTYDSARNRGVQTQKKMRSVEPELVMRCLMPAGMRTTSPGTTFVGAKSPISARPSPATMM